eukprot:scaffold12_cov368-Pavlova_lutheri.AAC.8
MQREEILRCRPTRWPPPQASDCAMPCHHTNFQYDGCTKRAKTHAAEKSFFSREGNAKRDEPRVAGAFCWACFFVHLVDVLGNELLAVHAKMHAS